MCVDGGSERDEMEEPPCTSTKIVGNEYAHYLDWCNGFTGVFIGQNLQITL